MANPYEQFVGDDNPYSQFIDAASIPADVLKSAGVGAAKGAIGFADLPYWLETGLNKGNEYLVSRGLAVPRERSPALSEPLSPGIQRAIEGFTGPFYKPQTKAGEVAQTVEEFLPSAVTGPGGIGRRVITQAVAPGLASEAAGAATEGTAIEPYARAGGAVLGGLGGSIAGAPRTAGAPSMQALKGASQQAYKTAEDQGVIIAQPSIRAAVDDITNELAKAGTDATLHPKVVAAWKRLDSAAEQNVSLEGAEILRRVVSSAATSIEKDERRLARIMLDKLDDYVEKLKPSDVLTGDPKVATAALSKARDLWSKSAKAEMVEGWIQKAQNRAGQFTGSGYENALRTEFRKAAQNDRVMRRLKPEERSAIQEVARGGPISNTLRMLGKLAPRGVVSAGLGGGAGYTLAGGDPIGAGAVFGLGEVGRAAATALTKRNVRNVSELVRGGKKLPSVEQDAMLNALKALYLSQPQFGR